MRVGGSAMGPGGKRDREDDPRAAHRGARRRKSGGDSVQEADARSGGLEGNLDEELGNSKPGTREGTGAVSLPFSFRVDLLGLLRHFQKPPSIGPMFTDGGGAPWIDVSGEFDGVRWIGQVSLKDREQRPQRIDAHCPRPRCGTEVKLKWGLPRSRWVCPRCRFSARSSYRSEDVATSEAISVFISRHKHP